MQPAQMSADVRLSDHLLNIKSILVNQAASATKQNHVTVSCSFCEHLRQRCAELEQKICEMQSTMSSQASSPQESPEKITVPDDCLMLSIQETLPHVDIRSSHSGFSSSSFELIDNEREHDMNGPGSVMSSDSELLLQSIDNAQNLTSCEHDQLCDPISASQTTKRIADLTLDIQLLQFELESYKEDFNMERDEKNKLKRAFEQLQRQLDVARSENEHASRRWREFEQEVHLLRDDNQDLRDELRRLKMTKRDEVIPAKMLKDSATHSKALPLTSQSRNRLERSDVTKKRQHVLVDDGPKEPTCWTCSRCSKTQTSSWQHGHCEDCGFFCNK